MTPKPPRMPMMPEHMKMSDMAAMSKKNMPKGMPKKGMPKKGK